MGDAQKWLFIGFTYGIVKLETAIRPANGTLWSIYYTDGNVGKRLLADSI